MPRSYVPEFKVEADKTFAQSLLIQGIATAAKHPVPLHRNVLRHQACNSHEVIRDPKLRHCSPFSVTALHIWVCPTFLSLCWSAVGVICSLSLSIGLQFLPQKCLGKSWLSSLNAEGRDHPHPLSSALAAGSLEHHSRNWAGSPEGSSLDPGKCAGLAHASSSRFLRFCLHLIRSHILGFSVLRSPPQHTCWVQADCAVNCAQGQGWEKGQILLLEFTQLGWSSGVLSGLFFLPLFLSTLCDQSISRSSQGGGSNTTNSVSRWPLPHILSFHLQPNRNEFSFRLGFENRSTWSVKFSSFSIYFLHLSTGSRTQAWLWSITFLSKKQIKLTNNSKKFIWVICMYSPVPASGNTPVVCFSTTKVISGWHWQRPWEGPVIQNGSGLQEGKQGEEVAVRLKSCKSLHWRFLRFCFTCMFFFSFFPPTNKQLRVRQEGDDAHCHQSTFELPGSREFASGLSWLIL